MERLDPNSRWILWLVTRSPEPMSEGRIRDVDRRLRIAPTTEPLSSDMDTGEWQAAQERRDGDVPAALTELRERALLERDSGGDYRAPDLVVERLATWVEQHRGECAGWEEQEVLRAIQIGKAASDDAARPAGAIFRGNHEYEIVRLLGSGGMALVHDDIVTILDSGSGEGGAGAYVAMELLAGATQPAPPTASVEADAPPEPNLGPCFRRDGASRVRIPRGQRCAYPIGKYQYCDDAGQCALQCTQNSECNWVPGNPICGDQGLCIADHCRDGKVTGGETAQDCGGRDCGPCPNGKKCREGADCQSGVCDEKGECARCTWTGQCAASKYCEKSTGVCTARKDSGLSCAVNDECVGVCAAGKICCNQACDGDCQSCFAALTGAANGVCKPVVRGRERRDECAGGLTCDGNGACEPAWAQGHECSLATECATRHCVDGSCCNVACAEDGAHCDSSGTCIVPPPPPPPSSSASAGPGDAPTGVPTAPSPLP